MPSRLKLLSKVGLACVLGVPAWLVSVDACDSRLRSRTAHAHPPPSAATPRAKPGPTAPLSAEEVARRAEIVASFEGGAITVGELEDAILSQNPFMQQRYLSTDAVRALLERSLRFALLAAEAERRGYGRAPAVVLAARQNAVQALIKQEFDDKISADAIPTADVKKYYTEHLDEFVRGEGRRVSVLLLAEAAAAERLLPQAQAADLRAFHELVRTHSVDETNKQRGGDLHFFNAQGRFLDEDTGSVDPALVRAAFALREVGDTSPVVQLADRYAIVRLTGVRAAYDESFEQADDRVRMRLWRERRQSAIDSFLDGLKKQLQVTSHPELVGAVKLEDGPPLPPADGLPSGFPHTSEPASQKASPSIVEPR